MKSTVQDLSRRLAETEVQLAEVEARHEALTRAVAGAPGVMRRMAMDLCRARSMSMDQAGELFTEVEALRDALASYGAVLEESPPTPVEVSEEALR